MHISGNQEYYWVAAHDFFLGSTVSPGHWGRVISSYLVGVPLFSGRVVERLPSALREFIFESVRLAKYPQLPSRLQAVFLCPSEADARQLQTSESPARDHEYVYRIELIGGAKTFRASLNLATIQVGDTVATLTEKAHLYWSGYETECMEILSTCPIRIREKMPSSTQHWNDSQTGRGQASESPLRAPDAHSKIDHTKAAATAGQSSPRRD